MAFEGVQVNIELLCNTECKQTVNRLRFGKEGGEQNKSEEVAGSNRKHCCRYSICGGRAAPGVSPNCLLSDDAVVSIHGVRSGRGGDWRTCRISPNNSVPFSSTARRAPSLLAYLTMATRSSASTRTNSTASPARKVRNQEDEGGMPTRGRNGECKELKTRLR